MVLEERACYLLRDVYLGQNRGFVPEGYMLSLPGFVTCPKEPLRRRDGVMQQSSF